MQKRFFIYPLIMLLMTACAKEDLLTPQKEQNADLIELAGIRVSIDNGSEETRANAPSVPTGSMPPALEDSIGRTSFGAYDQLVFTKICRTFFPLTDYSYNEIKFNHSNGAWDVVDATQKIYWSDGASGHTFIGYCLPHKTTEAAKTEGDDKNFDWVKTSDAYYYGSIGDPTNSSELLDYDATETVDDVAIPQNLRKEDLLLTYDTDIKNADGEPNANIVCHHALASVRVTVSITGFSNSDSDKDSESKVSNLRLEDLPVMYKWDQRGYGVEALTESDASSVANWSQIKTMKLWQPHPDGVGTGSGKSFVFYGINVPGKYDVPISFTVEYPDPLDHSKTLTKTYKATLYEAGFRAGYCTSITIALNHRNEQITVGAEYMTWEYQDSPDEGSLFKNTTYLESSDRAKITLMGDKDATADDATWLYVEEDGTIKDIYGHTGTEDNPFQISTAYQLLSFAYEVKGSQNRLKDRTGVTSIRVKEAPNSTTATKELNASSGFDFKNYHIRLDADLTLQKSTDKTKTERKNEGATDGSGAAEIVWPGIGDTDHAFEGNLMAKVRNISRLYGSPFFINIGQNARVCQLIMEHVIQINGDGGLAAKNNGVICACKVDGNVVSTDEVNPVGSLAGTNNGLIFACYHIGDVTGSKNVGGLIGNNQGYLVACYNMGKITAGSGYTAYAVAATAKENSIFGCFYDKTKAGELSICNPADGAHSDYPSLGKTTSEIIKPSFVGTQNQDDKDSNNPSLNGIINKWSRLIPTGGSYDDLKTHLAAHHYETQAASYPYVW